MTRSATLAAAVLATIALSGCGLISRVDGPDTDPPAPAPSEINWTEADFARDFAAQTRAEQLEMCDWFWSVSQAQYNDMLTEAGYLDTQVVNSWNVLVEVCP